MSTQWIELSLLLISYLNFFCLNRLGENLFLNYFTNKVAKYWLFKIVVGALIFTKYWKLVLKFEYFMKIPEAKESK